MKNRILLALLLTFPLFAQGANDKSTTKFKLIDLAREIKGQIFHQTPGTSISNLGLGVRFVTPINGNLGFDWGVNLDFLRTSSLISTDPSLTYNLSSRSYVLGGISYSLPTADWGYQYGAGFRVRRQLTFDLTNRQINPQYAALQFRATYYFN